jgi:hypothetical protein
MVMLPGSLAWSPALSVTLMVKVNVPAAAGVPPRWPPVRITPSGSWPAATVQVNGPTPPEVKKLMERGGPQPGRQFTVSVDTASAASITARPGTIFRSARLPRDPLPAPKLVAPAANVNAFPPLSA